MSDEWPGSPGRRLVGIDPRSLGLFRIGLALLLLWDLGSRSRNLLAHYTDAGIVPRSALLAWRGETGHVSLHLANGSAWLAGLLFLLAGASAAALLVGYRTRLATILSWLLLTSLHARNPLVLHGGDGLLRVLLFWAMFLPLESAWSNAGSPSRSKSGRPVASIATLAVRLQVCLVYWTTVALKQHPIWTEDRTAVEMALHLDQLATGWGRALLDAPAVLKVATAATLAWELVGPLLVWIPAARGRPQMVVVFGFWVFHLLLLAPAMALGNFPWVAAVAWVVFLPAYFWDETRFGGAMAKACLLNRRIAMPGRPSRATGPRRLAPPAIHRWPFQVAAGCFLALVVAWNLRTIDPGRFDPLLPGPLDTLGEATGLEQRWDLFAPFPSAEDGWFTAPGRLANGGEVDVLTGEPPIEEKPRALWRRLGNERERKLWMNLAGEENALHRRALGKWLCRQWNERHGERERLETFRLIFHLELTDPEGPRELDPLPLLLWSQTCSGGGRANPFQSKGASS